MGRVAILSPLDPSLHPPLTLSQRRTACLVNISLMDKGRYFCLLNIPFSSYPSAPLTPYPGRKLPAATHKHAHGHVCVTVLRLSKGKDW